MLDRSGSLEFHQPAAFQGQHQLAEIPRGTAARCVLTDGGARIECVDEHSGLVHRRSDGLLELAQGSLDLPPASRAAVHLVGNKHAERSPVVAGLLNALDEGQSRNRGEQVGAGGSHLEQRDVGEAGGGAARGTHVGWAVDHDMCGIEGQYALDPVFESIGSSGCVLARVPSMGVT